MVEYVSAEAKMNIVIAKAVEAEKTMKKLRILTTLAAFLFAAVLVSGCTSSEFHMSSIDNKRMTITAVNSSEGSSFSADALEVEEGEKITITADLKKGSVQVRIVAETEPQSIDTLPDISGDAIITANLTRNDSQSATLPAGTYAVEATCLEKADGNITIEVQPAS